MKPKATCCNKLRRKARACRGCPLLAPLGKKQRRKTLKKLKKRLARAA